MVGTRADLAAGKAIRPAHVPTLASKAGLSRGLWLCIANMRGRVFCTTTAEDQVSPRSYLAGPSSIQAWWVGPSRSPRRSFYRVDVYCLDSRLSLLLVGQGRELRLGSSSPHGSWISETLQQALDDIAVSDKPYDFRNAFP